MTPKTGRPVGRPKGAKSKRTKELVAAATQAAEKIAEALPDAFEGNSHAFLMTVYKDPGQPIATRIDAAKSALPYEMGRMAPIEANQREDDHVPLAERLRHYARKDAIAASEGKLIEFKARR